MIGDISMATNIYIITGYTDMRKSIDVHKDDSLFDDQIDHQIDHSLPTSFICC